MADPFADNFGEQQATPTTDAGANFLAQEENEIAALENQLLSSNIEEKPAESTQAQDLFGGDFMQTSEPAAVPEQQNDVDLLAGGDDDTPIFETTAEAQPVQEEAAPAVAIPLTSEPVISTPISNTMSSPAYDIQIEAESIRQWREENTARLAAADEKEAADKQNMIEQARKELEEWARQRKDTLEKTKAANRESEKAFIEERESRSKGEISSPSDIDWTKTSDLCDFNPKSSKGSKDTSRMRSLFLHLKEKK